MTEHLTATGPAEVKRFKPCSSPSLLCDVGPLIGLSEPQFSRLYVGMTGTCLIGLLGTVNKVMLIKVSAQCPQSAEPTVGSGPSHRRAGGLSSAIQSFLSEIASNVLLSRQTGRGFFFHCSYPFSHICNFAGRVIGNWKKVCWTFEAGAQGVQTWMSSQVGGRGRG